MSIQVERPKSRSKSQTLQRVAAGYTWPWAHPQTMTADQLTTPDRAEATPDHEPVRPTFGLTEAARLTGTSRSTIKRKLAAGEFPNATKGEDNAWRFSPGDLLAAGLKLRTPAEVARNRDDEDQADDEAAELLDRIADLERLLTIERVRREAAEQVAAEREKRAETAEWALLMLEARPSPVPSHQPEAVRPGAAESAGPSAGRFRAWIGIPSPPGSGAGCSAPSAAGRRSSRGPGCGRHLAWTCCLWLPSCHPTLGGAWGSRRTWSSSLRRS